MPRTFYRIVTENPPTVTDFMSYQALGIRPLRSDPESLRLASGVSVFATLAQAQRRAQSMPWLGQFIAVLEIPAESSSTCERTDRRSRGHYTLWGDAEDLLSLVIAVVSVEERA